MVDASSPTQLSASCVQLLGLLSAEQLAEASVMILFNKTYGSVSPEGVRGVSQGGAPWSVARRGARLGGGTAGAGAAPSDRALLSRQ